MKYINLNITNLTIRTKSNKPPSPAARDLGLIQVTNAVQNIK